VVRTYSGGMQRRLDVAMGLMHEPHVLFLDEPTTGLDPEARRDVWREIRAVAAERAQTILLTTHYLEEADEFADRLAIMDRGKIVAAGTPDELKRALQGDSIRLQLARDIDGTAVERALDPVAGIAEVTVADRAVRARAGDGAATAPRPARGPQRRRHPRGDGDRRPPIPRRRLPAPRRQGVRINDPRRSLTCSQSATPSVWPSATCARSGASRPTC
jgi:hypothetical protein